MIRELDLPRSTVSRLVRFLTEKGYLQYSKQGKIYSLGPASFKLGQIAIGASDLAAISRDVLEQVNQRTRETVVLMRYDPNSSSMICVDALPGLHEGLVVSEKAGSIFPLYAGASAKCVLAVLPDAQREAILNGPLVPQGHAPRITAESLRAQIDRIRQLGYATAESETYPGVHAVSFAIIGVDGTPKGSIAIAAPGYRMTGEARKLMTEVLKQGAEQIRRRLTGAVEQKQTGNR